MLPTRSAVTLVWTILIAAICGCGRGGDPATKTYELTFGHLANEQTTWHQAALKFAELCEQKSAGRLQVKVYPNEQLGKEMDMITGIQAGTVDMTLTGESMQNWVDQAVFCAVPYLIRDDDHLDKVAGGPIGRAIEDQLRTGAGVRAIAYFARSARNLTSNRPIKHPDDLKGMILRLPNDPMAIAVWEALGAKPTPMAFSEVFTALQQGTVEGQENPFALIDSAAFYEVQKYCNLTEHTISWIYVVVGEAQFASLPEDLQQVVLEAGREMQAYERELFIAERDRLAKRLREKGMTFVEVDKEAFKRAAQQAVLDELKPDLHEMYKAIQAVD
jgi:tripartite ATP-independent transporter DctP family solute receptor